MAKLVLIRHGQSVWNLENRFTGWIDIELTAKGIEEAVEAGKLLKAKAIHFDIAFTSVLKRAIDTLDYCLESAGQVNVPTEKDQALNERHYGDLQGLDKAETAKKYGDEQVKLWRRSYDVQPPNGESLKDTAARTLPYFYDVIMPAVQSGKNTVVSAHGNSLRAIVMMLDNLDTKQVLELNIANGVPIVYDIDAEGKVISKEILS